MQEVTGSSPVSPTNHHSHAQSNPITASSCPRRSAPRSDARGRIAKRGLALADRDGGPAVPGVHRAVRSGARPTRARRQPREPHIHRRTAGCKRPCQPERLRASNRCGIRNAESVRIAGGCAGRPGRSRTPPARVGEATGRTCRCPNLRMGLPVSAECRRRRQAARPKCATPLRPSASGDRRRGWHGGARPPRQPISLTHTLIRLARPAQVRPTEPLSDEMIWDETPTTFTSDEIEQALTEAATCQDGPTRAALAA